MRNVRQICIPIIFVSLICWLTACSSGGGVDAGSVNNTTWNELVWDDGMNDKTRKWAD